MSDELIYRLSSNLLAFCVLAVMIGCDSDVDSSPVGTSTYTDTSIQTEPDTDEERETSDDDNANPESNEITTYLALGDSYTIGEGVIESERWPIQLTSDLEIKLNTTIKTKILAQTGWTTSDLIFAMNQEQDLSDTTFTYVSLLIGVNNQFQGLSFSLMEDEFQELLDRAITLSGNNKDNVFVLSIPDYGVTSLGQSFGGSTITSELMTYNNHIKETCSSNGIEFVNITTVSNIMSDDQFTSDGLHPNGYVYGLWVDEVLETVPF
ncbi:SGNH/GDSL hydrolase family protein [Reichenbachiella versicolor]|uniref:SGNH/GDSL hydrolase family protein n=1 Tax=Reichenbachiella versicolor TaxID=1821036 RepID=UPI000D6E44E7|nr:SGNH/GDSL hydrolase family protein [Reichenbachiella versicolor]